MLVESLSHLSTVHCSTTLALTDEDQHCSRQQKPHGEAGGLLLCRRRLLCSSSRWSTNLRRLRRLCHVCRESGKLVAFSEKNFTTVPRPKLGTGLARTSEKNFTTRCRCRQTHHTSSSLPWVLCFMLFFRHGTGAHTHTGTITQVHPRKEFNRKEKCAHTTGKETEATTGWANSRGTNEGRDGGSSG